MVSLFFFTWELPVLIPYTVSLAHFAAFSICVAISIVLEKKSSSFILDFEKSLQHCFFSHEHMKRVLIASSWGLVMELKSQVTASCLILATKSRMVSPGFRRISAPNLYLSRTTNLLGWNCSSMNSSIVFVVRLFMSMGGDFCFAKLSRSLKVTDDWFVRKICERLFSCTECASTKVLNSPQLGARVERCERRYWFCDQPWGAFH